jgi:hypothetical protein
MNHQFHSSSLKAVKFGFGYLEGSILVKVKLGKPHSTGKSAVFVPAERRCSAGCGYRVDQLGIFRASHNIQVLDFVIMAGVMSCSFYT